MSEAKQSLPVSVNLRIIGACNLACPFCYGPHHSLPAVNTEKLLRLIQLFPRLGVKRVVVTGGEPLLVPDLSSILKELKTLELNILLNTNGVLLKQKFDTLCPYIDWIALPLDAEDPVINARMRPGPLLDCNGLQDAINHLRAGFPSLKIRVGTVITALNYENVPEIPQLLKGDYAPDVWRLYQFTPASYGFHNRKELDISGDLFESAAMQCEIKAKEVGLRVDVYRLNTRDRRYLFVEPNGDAMITVGGREVIIGNCFEDLGRVSDVCVRLMDYKFVEDFAVKFP